MADAGKQTTSESQIDEETDSNQKQIRKIFRPLGGSALFYLKEGISTGSHFMPPEFEPAGEELEDGLGS